MKSAATGAALGLLLALQPCSATKVHRRHTHNKSTQNSIQSAPEDDGIEKRLLGICSFPEVEGLVAITPSGLNAGWAMSPDQLCTWGSYCPYACPPGKVMAQWQPGSTYATTARMNGGLRCELDGTVSKPFSSKEYCVDGTGTVSVTNKAGSVVSFCQTVLPGNEDILIPTEITSTATLAVPDPSYWEGTAAHYYVNAPGVTADEGCHWGDLTKPVGNWAPFVAGANTDSNGVTYVKLGINPIWQNSLLYNTKPTFGLKIECDDCVGMPCAVDGNGVTSKEAADGAGGAAFCVATAPKGSSAKIVVYNLDGSGASHSSSSVAAPITTSTHPKPTTSSTQATTSTTPSSAPPSTTTSSTAQLTTSSAPLSSTSTPVQTSSFSSSAVSSALATHGAIFQEKEGNFTATGFTLTNSSSSTSKPTALHVSSPEPTTTAGSGTGEATTSESATNHGLPARNRNGAIAGLVVALLAAALIL